MMSKIYQWILSFILGGSVVFAVFLVASDNLAPFTTQAQLHIPTSRIAAEVSAPVVELLVKNEQAVQKGDVLVKLDPIRYQLALSQAKAALVQAEQNYQAKKQQLIGAQAALLQRQKESENAQRKLTRNKQLAQKKIVSQEVLDDTLADAVVRQQAVTAAQAQIAQIQAQLLQSSDTGALAGARAKVAVAELNLAKTTIVAPVDGVISNLNLNKGTYVGAGSPILFMVDRQRAWINADFNEKGMRHLSTGAQVRLVFDALPGQVFEGSVQGHELAIHDASSDNNGLAHVENDERWIRDKQKVRTQIVVSGLDPDLFSGSKVSVMVKSPSTVWSALGSAWMELLSVIRYLV
ncbi:HlyD family secretion protein [Shewanella intestini]|uniref:HlyD family secretion protein n=1 Tax=Shewanella intestini TaxID=2017544 RepID=A0ABS5HY98_9GAMM|nr:MULTISPECIES: HlyD family secretion protein [Shewanella]MBR9726591.1 HlyD family secretion protein [Shewanella intestini]MRG34843.1 biotin/lipoyl-binding protein [Shewanella sp. XMDDZSB0408]